MWAWHGPSRVGLALSAASLRERKGSVRRDAHRIGGKSKTGKQDRKSTHHGGIDVAALASPLSALRDTAALEADHQPNG
jgi:hypothetical protein